MSLEVTEVRTWETRCEETHVLDEGQIRFSLTRRQTRRYQVNDRNALGEQAYGTD